MRVQVMPASAAGTPGHPLTGFVIDGRLAVDAGPLGCVGTVEDQANIADVLLTHAHIDHVAGLPIFLDNVYRLRDRPPAVYGLPETLAALRADVFNGRLMPDFVGMSERMPPFLTLHPVTPDRPFAAGGYTVTPIPMKHTIGTVGYLIDDRESAVAVITDTGPIPDTLTALSHWPRLTAVFLECSYPDRLADLAELTHHQTVTQFVAGARLFPPDVRVYAVHVKPRYADEVRADLAKHGLPADVIAEGGRVVEG